MAAMSKVLTCSCYELGHTWDPSCLSTLKEIAFYGFTESFKIYAPLYLLAALLRRKKKEYYKKRLLPEILQSTLFLGTNAFCFIGAFCAWRRLAGFYCFFNVFLCGIPAGSLAFLLERPDRLLLGRFTFPTISFMPAFVACYIAINLERKSRRGVLAVYLMNLACETAFRMLVSRGHITPIKNGEVLFFSVVTAFYMYLFRQENGLKAGVLNGLRFLLGSSEIPSGPSGHLHLLPSGSTSSIIVQRINQNLPEICRSSLGQLHQGPKHRLCRHSHGCLSSALEHFACLFGFGFSISGVIKVLGALPGVVRKPGALVRAFIHRENWQLGMFFGSFVGIFKIVNCLLRWLRNTDSELHGLVSGFVAGWSMMWYKSSSIAMYMASKLAEILYFKGIEKGIVPYIKWGDMLIYSISTSFVFHAAVFEPHNLRPAYWKFLLTLTNGRFAQMNRRLLECYETDANRMFGNFYPNYDPRLTNLAR